MPDEVGLGELARGQAALRESVTALREAIEVMREEHHKLNIQLATQMASLSARVAVLDRIVYAALGVSLSALIAIMVERL